MGNYAIGQQDFKALREEGGVYVDKTMFISRLMDTKSRYIFLARPRRFGKSLFVSTLRYFFEGKRELFKDLYVDSTDWKWVKYPVLRLDFTNHRFDENDKLEMVLNRIFSEWEEEYKVPNPSSDLSIRFSEIIRAAYLAAGQPVVILVDEYDKPLVANLNNDGLFDAHRAKLASVYSNFKSSAEYIKLVFITGVSRFSKLSVFSDLNNLRDISFSNYFADICGITEKELLTDFQEGINKIAEERALSFEEVLGQLKLNYDGYRFAEAGSDIYNPWSLLNAMEESRIGNYWNLTGLPTLIAETLKNLDIDLQDCLNTVCDLATLEGLDLKSPDPLALLYQTGYLTIKEYDAENNFYTLGLPNKEVTDGLFKVLLPYYVKVKSGSVDGIVRNIIRDIQLGKPEGLRKSLDAFFAGVPYDMHMDNENNFHNALYILMTLIGVKSETEVHTSDGRIDLEIATPKFIYIIELKYDRTVDEAISQIQEKHYDRKYATDERKLFKIGANFSSKTRNIEGWKVIS